MPEKLYKSYSLEKSSDNSRVITSGSLTYWSDTPTSTYSIGDDFRPVPEAPLMKVAKVSIKDSVIGEHCGLPVRQWQITVEGSNDTSLPANEQSIEYELNGVTARTVDGEFVVLRRSSTPITRKSITVCTSTNTAVVLPGATYEGGIVTSVNIVKETTKINGADLGTYYKQTIEVEL